ncbi:hypothetical protein [Gulosibacter bifidus]|uniref:Uncharacterized protein n=1 Tax=Gulosibacter bifidus TaxID=272239 RepID=A0ABW5RGB4_9MICO|nr:hypothetical protein [Gulosibacter bifidus]
MSHLFRIGTDAVWRGLTGMCAVTVAIVSDRFAGWALELGLESRAGEFPSGDLARLRAEASYAS